MSAEIEMLYHCKGPNVNIPYIEKIRNDRSLLNELAKVNFDIAYSAFQLLFLEWNVSLVIPIAFFPGKWGGVKPSLIQIRAREP